MGKQFNLMIAAFAVLVMANTSIAANPADLRKIDDVAKFSTCSNCDLTGANLQRRMLRLANLPGANLSGANLDGADLAGALLWDAKLQGASFVYANLSGAQMMNATAMGANFTNAWLTSAQAQNVKFGNANFAGARLRFIQLQGADISQVHGLDPRELAQACGDASTKVPPGAFIPRCVE